MRSLLRFFSLLLLSTGILVFSARLLLAGDSFPQRIVSLGPIHTENVFLLGAGDRLIANTLYCIHPPEAREKVKIGSVMQLNIEQIFSLHPDLILATGLTTPQQVAQLAASGVRVIHFRQPESFAGICEQFLELGRVLGLEEKAREIVAQAREGVRQVQQRVGGLPRMKVFLQVGTQPLFAAVENSFTHDYIALGGGLNVAAGRADGWVNQEMVTAWNPDVIIIALMGSEWGIGKEEKKRWSGCAPITAAQKQQIHVVDPDLVCSPSPLDFVKGLEMIAALIHPPSLAEAVSAEVAVRP